MQPIIVFDSGIGGLSIYRPLKLALPKDPVLYSADSVNFPYGNKSPSFLRKRLSSVAKEFSALNPRAVVIACNTATVNALDIFRSQLTCPVVGIEPVIKPLVPHDSALALMTSSSAKSSQTKELLNKYGSHVQIYTPVGLAEAIEYNDITQVKKILTRLSRIIKTKNITAIGLSCTHYPLILSELKRRFPSVTFIDPSLAVVKQVLRVLR